MDIYITLDVEGVTTVTNLEQVRHGDPEFQPTRVLLTEEINAAIEGALAANVDGVLVNEGHGKHRNVIPKELNPKARLLTGRNKLFHLMQGIDRGFGAMFMIGYHAGAGKRYGILGHTFHAYNCTVNGRYMSEIGLCVALAGYYGVPTVLVTGDEESCRDALDLVPNMETVAVKEGISAASAINLHPAVAQQKIREAAERAIKRLPEIQPFKIEPPLTMDLDLYSPLMGDMHDLIPGCVRTGDRSVRYKADDFAELFKFFLLSSTLSMTTFGQGVMV
jgi:D-amino peptidase